MAVKPERLLENGARHLWPDGAESVSRVVQVASLAGPTGRIAACGIESVLNSAEFIDRPVAVAPAGQYPLILSIASFPPNEYFPNGFERVAAAGLRLRPSVIRTWSKSDRALDIDAGTGCFFDLAHSGALIEMSEQPDADLAVIQETLEKRFTVRPSAANPAEVAFFECGMGDGSYDLWIGYEDSGGAGMLLADLELLDHAQRIE